MSCVEGTPCFVVLKGNQRENPQFCGVPPQKKEKPAHPLSMLAGEGFAISGGYLWMKKAESSGGRTLAGEGRDAGLPLAPLPTDCAGRPGFWPASRWHKWPVPGGLDCPLASGCAWMSRLQPFTLRASSPNEPSSSLKVAATVAHMHCMHACLRVMKLVRDSGFEHPLSGKECCAFRCGSSLKDLAYLNQLQPQSCQIGKPARLLLGCLCVSPVRATAT